MMSGTALCSLLLATAGTLTVTGCSDSTTGIDIGPPVEDDSEFAVRGTTVINGSVWKLNREIQIEFTQDLDFSTVSSSTIQIIDTQGVPAIGTFSAAGPRTVRFQPKCPTNATNSDGGFAQGKDYRLTVLSQTSAGIGGGVTVTNTAGDRLESGLNVVFSTPVSNDELVLFVDVVAGPPQVRILGELDAAPATTEDQGFSYVEFGGDPNNFEFFRFDSVDQQGEIASLVPLNLYSDTSQQFSVVLQFNQPIVAAPSNVNRDLIRLQYFNDASSAWLRVPSTVTLLANCTSTGAAVRVTPTGIVPQGAAMRIELREGFRDLTGDSVQSSQTTFARFQSTLANPDGLPADQSSGSDEILERFTVGGTGAGSLEDTSIASAQPRANWGNSSSPGALSASFDFDGTGGIGGDFDVKILAGESVFINTTSDVISGGPGSSTTSNQPVINGRLDCRNLTIEPGGRLVFIGPNTASILATGTVSVAGLISVNGSDNFGVGALNTANQPEEGAPGQAGGGSGGVGSNFTSQSTPAGTAGNGAFDVPGLGGGGGESTYATTAGGCDKERRRAAGGGGGSLGSSIRYIVEGSPGLPPAICQMFVGMDGEPGFSGSLNGTGAISQTGPAEGGYLAPTPFLDASPNNDFFGTMITAEGQQIRGELTSLWAGSGGGGGGDSVGSENFPLTPFVATGDEKGSGGGGGAGGLLILSIGNINILPGGEITAIGGDGGGGENVIFFDRIGGGSGGGSGGHVVMSSAASILIYTVATGATVGDFYQDVTTNINRHEARPIRSLGGQGGAGREDRCGAGAEGPTGWRADAIPFEAFEGRTDIPPNTGTLPNTFNWCNDVPGGGGCNGIIPGPEGTAFGAGGDGSPGIIQLHVADPETQLGFGGDPDDPLNPPAFGYATASDPTRSMAPPPIGWTNDTDRPDVLIPFFSSRSESFSRWIPLGLARLNGDGTSNPVEFIFEGTDATASIIRNGTTAQELPAVYPFTAVTVGGAAPSVNSTAASFIIPGADIADPNDLYKRNALLLREFSVRLRNSTNPGDVREYDIVTASYSLGDDEYTIVVDPRDLSFSATVAEFSTIGGSMEAEIVPFYYRVVTSGVEDLFPNDTDIKVLFDATLEDPLTGEPSANAEASYSSRVDANLGDLSIKNGFAEDINELNGQVAAPDQTDPLNIALETVAWDFVRFKVEFNIATGAGTPTGDSPRPGIDFLRIPYRF